MSTYSIAVFLGSLRRESFNRKLALALTKLGPPEFQFQFADLGRLPLYNQDEELQPADTVKAMKTLVYAAQGLLFVTPEYNRSVPGVLKNALDHGSRPYGQSVWAGKPAGVLGVSIGQIGTALAQQHLRNILAYLDVPTLGQPEVFLRADAALDSTGALKPETRDFLRGWMERYVAWIKQHAR
jgi:chromate reductase